MLVRPRGCRVDQVLVEVDLREVVSAVVGGAIVYIGQSVLGRPLRRFLRKAEPVLGGLDIAYVVHRDPSNMPFTGLDFATRFYFPNEFEPPNDVPEQVDEWWFWAHSMGGKDIRRTKVLITFQGVEEGATVMIGPPRLESWCSPLDPGLICGPGGLGGGGVQQRRYEVTLFNARPPEITYLDEGELEPQFTLSAGDSEQVALFVSAGDPGYHEWICSIPLVVNGVERTLDVRHGRNPFVTIGPTGDCTALVWNGSGWRQTDPLTF